MEVSEKKMKKKIKSQLFYLTRAISWLDDVRKGLYTNPEKIDKAILKSDLPQVKSIWKKAKKELRVLTRNFAMEKKIRKYAIAGTFLRTAAVLSLGLFGLIYVNTLMNFQKKIWLINLVRNPISIILFIIVIPNTFMIVDYFARQNLKERMIEIGIQEKKRLKKVINQLIEILVKEAKKGKIKPKKLKLRLFFDDYEQIEVLKKPGRLRKTYEIIPRL